jgi:CRISPR-associated protein Cas1
LEVSLGALHEFHPGRPSLACDLMESLRTPAVDRWLIRVCNRRELHPKDFQMTDHGVRLRAGVFGRVLATWEQHWTDRGQEHALQQQTKWFIQELRQSDEGEVTGDTGAATQVSERSSGE